MKDFQSAKGLRLKRYHVISISVLLGLIVGLSVSKAAEANTLVCSQTMLENAQGVNGNPGALVIDTKAGFASMVFGSTKAGFHMHRVINKGWKASDTKNRFYTGTESFKGGQATLSIVMIESPDSPLTVQYEANGDLGQVRIIGLNCTNVK
ncbi:hypothetical protein IGT34_004413 [Salmonella enterica]|nr:hypothetical protein [Salmonella enterica]